MVRVPQFAVPFSVVDGTVQEIEQDSLEEVGDCIEAILRTPEGSRIDAPDFGRPDLVFTQVGARAVNAEPYLRVIEEQEPRASVIGSAEIEDAVERIVIDQEE